LGGTDHVPHRVHDRVARDDGRRGDLQHPGCDLLRSGAAAPGGRAHRWVGEGMSCCPHESPMLGVERLLGEDGGRSILAGRRVGLIANPTSVDRALTHTADLLRAGEARGGYRLTALFAPEHGLHAAAEATSLQEHGVDPRTGLPVWSLYSETTEPTRRMLADVDVLVYDLQDVGVRYYTFIWTMYRAMSAAAREGRAFVVLDRPNPLGDRVDGP